MDADSKDSKFVTVEWSTRLQDPGHLVGLIDLGRALEINFPILKTGGEVPSDTKVLWGIGEDLKRYTAVNDFILSPGTRTLNRTGIKETNYFLTVPLQYLLIGYSHVASPRAEVVQAINFEPYPNHLLHASKQFQFIAPREDITDVQYSATCADDRRQFHTSDVGYFLLEPAQLWEIDVPEIGGSIRAYTADYGWPTPFRGRRYLRFELRFTQPKSISAAIDESMKFSTLLSFLAHTYVYPGRLCIKAGKDTDFRLEARDIPEKLGAERKSVSNTLCLPDQDIAKFCKIAKQWYETNEENLRGRYLYRNSLGEENTYTTERFLWIFQALEGAIPKKGYTLLEETELQQVIKAATNALPEDPRAAAVAGKLRSSNSGSLPYILKQELPKLFASAGVEASFDIATFVDRIYRRRSKSAHGGAHLDDEQHGVTLIEDTLLLTAIYLVRECAVLGMDAREALRKLGSALWYDAIPLK